MSAEQGHRHTEATSVPQDSTHQGLSPRKGFGTHAGFLGPCFATPSGYPHFSFLEMPQNFSWLCSTAVMVDEMREAGKQDTHPSKSCVGGERKQSTTNPVWEGGTVSSEGYKVSKMEMFYCSREARALGNGIKVTDPMGGQLVIQARTRGL